MSHLLFHVTIYLNVWLEPRGASGHRKHDFARRSGQRATTCNGIVTKCWVCKGEQVLLRSVVYLESVD